jgi:hypothetical protein
MTYLDPLIVDQSHHHPLLPIQITRRKNALLTDIARRGIPQAQFINLLSDKSGIDG